MYANASDDGVPHSQEAALWESSVLLTQIVLPTLAGVSLSVPLRVTLWYKETGPAETAK